MDLIFLVDIYVALIITIYLILKRVIMPLRVIWISGKHDYIEYVEAPNDESYCQALNGPVIDAINDCNFVPLLFGPTNDRKKNRQLILHQRGNKR